MLLGSPEVDIPAEGDALTKERKVGQALLRAASPLQPSPAFAGTPSL